MARTCQTEGSRDGCEDRSRSKPSCLEAHPRAPSFNTIRKEPDRPYPHSPTLPEQLHPNQVRRRVEELHDFQSWTRCGSCGSLACKSAARKVAFWIYPDKFALNFGCTDATHAQELGHNLTLWFRGLLESYCG